MADNDNRESLMESLLQCIGWPNTPSRARLRRSRDLYDLIPDGGESRGESGHFSTCVQNARFGEWAGDEFEQLRDQESGILVYHLMADVATMGDSDDAIGLAVSGGPCAGGKALFGRLHRDPQWMGLEPMLGMLEGLAVQVFPSEGYRDRPGSAVAALPGSLRHRGNPGPFPQGVASTLKKLLEGHGAVPADLGVIPIGDAQGESIGFGVVTPFPQGQVCRRQHDLNTYDVTPSVARSSATSQS